MKFLNVPVTEEIQAHLTEYAKQSGMTKKKIVELSLVKYFNETATPSTVIARPLPKL
jgi:hypothetical protein